MLYMFTAAPYALALLLTVTGLWLFLSGKSDIHHLIDRFPLSFQMTIEGPDLTDQYFLPGMPLDISTHGAFSYFFNINEYPERIKLICLKILSGCLFFQRKQDGFAVVNFNPALLLFTDLGSSTVLYVASIKFVDIWLPPFVYFSTRLC